MRVSFTNGADYKRVQELKAGQLVRVVNDSVLKTGTIYLVVPSPRFEGSLLINLTNNGTSFYHSKESEAMFEVLPEGFTVTLTQEKE